MFDHFFFLLKNFRLSLDDDIPIPVISESPFFSEKGLERSSRPKTFDGIGIGVSASNSSNSFAVSKEKNEKSTAVTVVSIIRQALATRDTHLLSEALYAPVKPEDSCRALDAQVRRREKRERNMSRLSNG